MVKIHGVPLIDRMLDILSEVPVTRVCLVIGHGGDRVREHVGSTWNGIPINYVVNDDYAVTNNIYSLFLAREYLAEQDTLLLESDLIFDPRIVEALVADPRPNLAVVDTLRDGMSGAVTHLGGGSVIRAFTTSGVLGEAGGPAGFKTVNIYKFASAFVRDWYVPQLTRQIARVGRTEYYEEVLKQLVEQGPTDLEAFFVGGRDWCEIDTPQDLGDAERTFTDPWDHYQRITTRYGGYWRFPALTDHCYLVNPFFPPGTLRQEIAARMPRLIAEYPSGSAVVEALAARALGVDASCTVVGNGASELIKALGSQLRGRRVGISYPTFDEYPAALTGSTIVPVVTAMEHAHERVEALESVMPDCDAVILVNPDNPSGSYIERERVLRFIDKMDRLQRLVVVDESFTDFSPEATEGRILADEVLRRFRHLVVVRSLGKSHGVAGLRLGVLASSNTGLLDRVRARLPVWNVSSPAEGFLQIVDDYHEEYVRACRAVAEERAVLGRSLTELGRGRALDSGANFVTFVLQGHVNSRDVAARMLRRGVLVKDLSDKQGVECQALRLAVRSRDDNRRLVEVMEASIRECVG